MTTPATQPVPLGSDLTMADPGATKDSLLTKILTLVDAPVPAKEVAIESFRDEASAAERTKGETLAAALSVFFKSIAELDHPVEQVNKALIEQLIARIDEKIGEQLDEVLHHPTFQHLESTWRGLELLVERTDFRKNTKIEVMDVSKEAMFESFEDASEIYQAGLYQRIYAGAYDQPGADPYGAMVSTYVFDNTANDLKLLTKLSQVAAGTHCPFIGSVGPQFFGKKSWQEWAQITDMKAHMETAEYIKWRAFRDTEDSRYVGLAFPRFLLRLPYGDDNPVKAFKYRERVSDSEERFLWGNAAFAFASNLVRAFKESGWCVQIRGPEAGGKVDGLPVHLYDMGRGKEMKPATEVLLDETRELACAELGFMPLSQYVGRDYACFFSAQSAQRPVIYDTADATANSRINARLPYIFLASRLAHYLKVIQRENIGTTKDRSRIEQELNRWLGGYIGEMKNPDERYIAKYPLRAAKVTVHDIEENPGFFRVEMMIIPHFQVEGMDITLSLVSKMPKATK